MHGIDVSSTPCYVLHVTSDEALLEVRGFAAAGRVRFTRHARARADKRAGGATVGELHVVHALKHATDCASNEAKWKVSGPDLDGDELTAVVVVDGGVIVVTVF